MGGGCSGQTAPSWSCPACSTRPASRTCTIGLRRRAPSADRASMCSAPGTVRMAPRDVKRVCSGWSRSAISRESSPRRAPGVQLSLTVRSEEGVSMSRVWLVTGSSRGLGRAFVEVALEAGDRVAATARNPERLQDLVDKFGDAVLPLRLDVTDYDAAERAVAQAVA